MCVLFYQILSIFKNVLFFTQVCPLKWTQLFIVFGTLSDTCVPLCFSLLPDKLERSYNCMFSQIKNALTSRELELSASCFISDFEQNIGKCFNSNFDDAIKILGCYFHYGKAIWSRVKKAGMQTYYSSKGPEKNFGFFIRLILGVFFII